MKEVIVIDIQVPLSLAEFAHQILQTSRRPSLCVTPLSSGVREAHFVWGGPHHSTHYEIDYQSEFQSQRWQQYQDSVRGPPALPEATSHLLTCPSMSAAPQPFIGAAMC